MTSTSIVYVCSTPYHSLVKVGFWSGSLYSLYARYRTPYGPEISFDIFPCQSITEERRLHQDLVRYRYHTELYHVRYYNNIIEEITNRLGTPTVYNRCTGVKISKLDNVNAKKRAIIVIRTGLGLKDGTCLQVVERSMFLRFIESKIYQEIDAILNEVLSLYEKGSSPKPVLTLKRCLPRINKALGYYTGASLSLLPRQRRRRVNGQNEDITDLQYSPDHSS